MLVLTRKDGERIIIKVGDTEIVVTVAELSNQFVRLGFEAPRDVIIKREELTKE